MDDPKQYFSKEFRKEQQREDLEWLEEEHQKLEQLCKEVSEKLSQGEVPKELLDNAIRLLKCYAGLHFRHEEAFFADLLAKDDPDRRRNEEEHRFFREWFEHFEERALSAKRPEEWLTLAWELYQKLEQWLHEHGEKVDGRLREKVLSLR